MTGPVVPASLGLSRAEMGERREIRKSDRLGMWAGGWAGGPAGRGYCRATVPLCLPTACATNELPTRAPSVWLKLVPHEPQIGSSRSLSPLRLSGW